MPRVVNWTEFTRSSGPLISDPDAKAIQEVAVAPGSTYFVVPVKPPNRGVGVVHREYKIIVHIPDRVSYYVLPIPQPEDKRESALEAGLNLVLGLSVGAASTYIPVLGPGVTILTFLMELYDIYSTETTLEGDIEFVLTNPNDAPNPVLDSGSFVVLLESRVERIEYTVGTVRRIGMAGMRKVSLLQAVSISIRCLRAISRQRGNY